MKSNNIYDVLLYTLIIVVGIILFTKIIQYINNEKVDRFNNINNKIKSKCGKCYDKIKDIELKIKEEQTKLNNCIDDNSCNEIKDKIENYNKELEKQKCDCNIVCSKDNLDELESKLIEGEDNGILNNAINKVKKDIKFYECSCANCLSLKDGYRDVKCLLKICKQKIQKKPINGTGETTDTKVAHNNAKLKVEEEQKNNIDEVKKSNMILNTTGVKQVDLIDNAEKLHNNIGGRQLSKEKSRSVFVEAENDNIEFAESREDVGGVISSSLGYKGYKSNRNDKDTDNVKVIMKNKYDNRSNGTQITGKMNEPKPLVLKSDKDNSEQHIKDLSELNTNLGQYDFGFGQGSNTLNTSSTVDFDIDQAHIYKNNIREAPIIYQSGVSGVSNIFAPHIIVNDGSGNLSNISDNLDILDNSNLDNQDPSIGEDMNGIPGLQGAKQMEAIFFSD